MSHTGLHEATQRLRPGRRPESRRLTSDALRRGSTGPGPGGRALVPTGCQTDGVSSGVRKYPGNSGRTGTVRTGTWPGRHRSTTAGHDAASSSMAIIAGAGSSVCPERTATPDRPGLSSARVGPSSIRSASVRSDWTRSPPARSMTSAVSTAAARPSGATTDRTGSGDSTASTPNLGTPPMTSNV